MGRPRSRSGGAGDHLDQLYCRRLELETRSLPAPDHAAIVAEAASALTAAPPWDANLCLEIFRRYNRALAVEALAQLERKHGGLLEVLHWLIHRRPELDHASRRHCELLIRGHPGGMLNRPAGLLAEGLGSPDGIARRLGEP